MMSTRSVSGSDRVAWRRGVLTGDVTNQHGSVLGADTGADCVSGSDRVARRRGVMTVDETNQHGSAVTLDLETSRAKKND